MKSKKISSLSFSLMILLSVISFGYILGSEVKQVSAEDTPPSGYSLVEGYTNLYKKDRANTYWTPERGFGSSSNNEIPSAWVSDGILKNSAGETVKGTAPAEEARAPQSPPAGNTPVPADPPKLDTPDPKPAVTYNIENDGKGLKGSDGKTLNPAEYEGKTVGGFKSDGKTWSKDYGDIGGKNPFTGEAFTATPQGYLGQGLLWATVAFGIINTLGQIATLAGADQEQIQTISVALSAGIIAGRSVYGGLMGRGGVVDRLTFDEATGTSFSDSKWGARLGGGTAQFIVGAATTWLTYNALYEKEQSKEIEVSFSCLPWQAPHGGQDCELCNDGILPCSEYRCKALGQSCGIENAGTAFEMCVNKNPRDVAPPTIKPLEDVLTEGLFYDDVKEMPPGAGFKIKSTETATGCIPPFTPFEWGIETNEPAQCKIDIEPKGNYSKMASYFGGDNLFSYNHTEYLSLPSAVDFKNSSISLENGRELNMFVRCIDSSGNANEADYNIKVCVDPSPDTTPPKILGSSILSESCVAANSDNTTLDFYVNEPSECRWSFTDERFELMDYNMSCGSNINEINALQVYTCNTLLTGIARDGTNFYVRCKDQPIGVNESKRNTNVESYQFNLRGSNPLKMKNLQPNETIFGSVRPTPVELYAETLFGCENNKATCFYSTTGAENSFIQFFDTNNEDGISTQRLDLYDGTHTYYIKCVDSGGNLASNLTTFKLEIDPNAPLIARVYEEDDYLKVVTPKDSECVYTNQNCDFLFDEGTPMPYQNSTTHVTQWFSDKTYYIKCRDAFRTEPTDCSIIVRPTDNFLD